MHRNQKRYKEEDRKPGEKTDVESLGLNVDGIMGRITGEIPNYSDDPR